MKRIIKNAAVMAAAALLITGCAKTVDTYLPVSNTTASMTEASQSTTSVGDLTAYSEMTVSGAATVAETTANVTTEEVTMQTVPPKPEKVRIHIAAAGDNLIHSSLYEQAAARANYDGYDFEYEYANVADYISQADIAILNQETLICNDTVPPSTYPCFNSPNALGDHMIDIGFDVFTMANNHVLDKRESGLKACLDYWDSHPEAVVLGAYRNEEDKENIRTFEKNGVKFSFLSYTESTNGLTLPPDSELVIGDANDIDGMVEDVKKAKEISDICIVSLHWGVENSSVISDYQRNTAKRLADAGADVIVGTHPHVLRDIEWIEREDGSRMLCVYSLGNFVSAQSKRPNLIGGVLDFYVESEDGKKPQIIDVSLIPTIQHYDKSYANNRVYFYYQYTPELAAKHGVNSSASWTMDYIDGVIDSAVSKEFLRKTPLT